MDVEKLTTIEDADLGTLDLIREHFRAKSPGDADRHEMSLLEWRGHHQGRDGLSFDIGVYVESDTPPPEPAVPDNARAALMTRGLAEISRLGVALGADPLTFAGLSGMGDLIVTCGSRHSRIRAH